MIIKNGEKIQLEYLMQAANKCKYDFQQYETITIYTGKNL